MPRSIQMMHKTPINPFEAIKRAYIRRGYIPRYFRKAADLDPSAEAIISKSESKTDSKSSGGYEMTEEESKQHEKHEKERAKQEVEDQAKIEYKPESEKKESQTESASSTESEISEIKSKEKELKLEEAKEEKKKEEDKKAEEQEKKSQEMKWDEAETKRKQKEQKKEEEMKLEAAAEKRTEENPMLAALKEEIETKKEQVKKEKSEHKIHEIKSNTEDILYECETFALFRDTLKLDREKLTMAKREFFRTADISSVPVSEIMSIEAHVGPIFGSVHMIFRFFNDNEKTFTYLWRKDAINLQRIIHGFIIAHRKGVDITKVPIKELRDTLVQIGQGVRD